MRAVRYGVIRDYVLDMEVALPDSEMLALGAQDVVLADTEERKSAIWDTWGAFFEAINGSTPFMDECDMVMPHNRIAEFVQASMDLGRRYDPRICSFGHAGDGKLHIYACKDALSNDIWEERRTAVMDALYQKARNIGGNVSGEHDIGHVNTEYVNAPLGSAQVALTRRIKTAFDPKGILNPGKVVGADANDTYSL